jgi:formylglycine-generating enzyme required for sulfatase activity
VTQKQWTTLMAHNPSRNKGDRRPVEQVAWHAAAEFAQALARKTSRACRLPTEAEWEYACRAGSENGFAGGREEGLAEHAWYFRNSKRCTHEVGTRRTNAWGLCDMHGNVAEFCQDWFAPYRAGLAVDPSGSPQGSSKVVRGGAFSLPAEWLDGRLRITVPPDAGKDTVGLRIAVDAVPNL